MLLVFKKTHRLAKSQEKNFVKKKWRKHKKFMNGNKGEIPKPLNPRTSGREEKRDAFKEKKNESKMDEKSLQIEIDEGALSVVGRMMLQ